MKKCGSCKKNKDESEFSKRGISRAGLKSWCRFCISSKSRRSNYNIKIEALQHYGGAVCKCCGITEPDFLALDHVDNDGAKQRREKKHGSGNGLYKWLKRNGYPNLNLQVLCHNCNMGKQIRGICPHLIERADALDPILKV